MRKTLKLDGVEYETKNLSDNSKKHLELIEFIANRVKDLKNTQSLLQRAKTSYMDSLKKEVLSKRSGFFSDED